MRNKIIHACTFVLFVSTIIQSRAVNADGQQINEGEMPYTPTRIEWLIANGRNECGFWLDGLPGVSFGLFNINGPNKKNTITLSVLFKDEKNRTEVQQAAETCARNLKASARFQHGWNWLKMEVEVRNSAPNAVNPKGFTLSKVDAKSSFAQLGLRDGDIVKTVNFQPVSSLVDAQKIDELLKSKKTIRVEFVRDGSTQDYTLER